MEGAIFSGKRPQNQSPLLPSLRGLLALLFPFLPTSFSSSASEFSRPFFSRFHTFAPSDIDPRISRFISIFRGIPNDRPATSSQPRSVVQKLLWDSGKIFPFRSLTDLGGAHLGAEEYEFSGPKCYYFPIGRFVSCSRIHARVQCLA